MQIIGLFLLILVFIALVAGIYLNVTARTASVGREIQSMQAKIEKLEQANADLQSQLAFLVSAGEMEKRASDLGFRRIETEETLFVVVPEYVVRQPASLAPAPGPVVAGAQMVPPEYTESIFDWLSRQTFQLPLPVLKVIQ
jgi:cell division protein FtsB